MDVDTAASIVLDETFGSNSKELHKALRYVKNSAIGKKIRKQIYIEKGVIPRLLKLLSDGNASNEVKLEALVCTGTLCYAENISTLSCFNFIPHLIPLLNSDDEKLVSMTLYAIGCVAGVEGVSLVQLFENHVLQKLKSFIEFKKVDGNVTSKLIDCESMKRCRYALTVISRMMERDPLPQNKFDSICTLIPPLLSLLNPSTNNSNNTIETVLFSLSKLLSIMINNFPTYLSKYLQDINYKHIMYYWKSNNVMSVYYSIQCMTYIYKSGILKTEDENRIKLPLLVIPLKIMSELSTPSPDDSIHPPLDGVIAVLYNILESDTSLHIRAIEKGIIKNLMTIIFKKNAAENMESLSKHVNVGPDIITSLLSIHKKTDNDATLINSLNILSSLCSSNDEFRKHLIDAEFLSEITNVMEHPNNKVRAVACKCTRNLTRSTKELSASPVKCGGISDSLAKLIFDHDIEMQIMATATICNLALILPATKRSALIYDILDKIVTFTESDNDQLRLHAVWALKNFTFNADSKVKISIIRQITWNRFKPLLNDNNTSVQIQTLNLLRNMVCGKNIESDLILANIDVTSLFKIINEKLHSGHQKIVLHSLYILVNLSSFVSSFKNIIVGDKNILYSIMRHISHPNPENRIAALWCVINFSWSDDDYGHIVRVSKLCEFGFEKCLFEVLVNDSSTDVKDKARMALLNLGHSLLNNNAAETDAEPSDDRLGNVHNQESSVA